MNNLKKEILDQAVKLELNVADLYLLYKDQFKEDRSFWKKMAQEEKNHAALLELAKDFSEKFPKEIIYDNLENLKSVNQEIEETIEKYKQNIPSKKEAYEYAFNLENSAYELHYQKLVTSDSSDISIRTFQKLNGDDKDHADRIRKLIDSHINV